MTVFREGEPSLDLTSPRNGTENTGDEKSYIHP